MLQRYFFICFLLVSVMMAYGQNYDEAKVPAYALPDVLKTSKGTEVHTVNDWEQQRRPELLSLFAHNIYGVMPKDFDSLQVAIVRTDKHAMRDSATLKEVDVRVWRKHKSVVIHVVLFTPNRSEKPAPVFLLIDNRGRELADPNRQLRSEFWPAEMAIQQGFAIAAFQVNDAAPDNAQHYQEGVLQLYPEQIHASDGMKAIGCWAWAASRVMDIFEKEKSIDAKQVFIVGHSRGGKAALWAGATDRRFAMVFANCSGSTGAALARRQYGETVKRINTSFPYWFCDNYKKYGDSVDALPVDQHMLIALIAPRPLYTTNATQDLWADPKGSFLSLKKAEPVYALYSRASALPAAPPTANTPVIQSVLGYHIREGVHDLTAYDWTNFLAFAKYHRSHRSGIHL